MRDSRSNARCVENIALRTNTAVSESAHVASVVSRIRGAGLDVVLNMEGTVDLSRCLERAGGVDGGFLRTLDLVVKFPDESTRTDTV